jgi:hypothetical protein
VQEADLGFFIHATVRAYNNFGFSSFFTPTNLGQSVSTPTPLSNPTISGTRVTGSELTASAGIFVAYPEPTTTHQWFSCSSQVSSATTTSPSQCSEISGATTNTYTQTSADAGKFLTVRTTKTNSAGTVSVWSQATATTNQPPTVVSDPTISGTASFGSTLTADPGTWQGFPTPTLSYQWYSCENEVVQSGATVPEGCVEINQVQSVAAGSSHTCALIPNGTVQCWGWNY